jgi:lipoate synthase
MDITYPFAKVFIDSTNKMNIFFCHDSQHTTFEQIGDIGTGIVAFCELDFSDVEEKIKAPETVKVTSCFSITSTCKPTMPRLWSFV